MTRLISWCVFLVVCLVSFSFANDWLQGRGLLAQFSVFDEDENEVKKKQISRSNNKTTMHDSGLVPRINSGETPMRETIEGSLDADMLHHSSLSGLEQLDVAADSRQNMLRNRPGVGLVSDTHRSPTGAALAEKAEQGGNPHTLGEDKESKVVAPLINHSMLDATATATLQQVPPLVAPLVGTDTPTTVQHEHPSKEIGSTRTISQYNRTDSGTLDASSSPQYSSSDLKELLAAKLSSTKPYYTKTTHQRTSYKFRTSRRRHSSSSLVQTRDFIYRGNKEWGSSPIVIESHKLVFFTVPKVGCTVWKYLFRRMMGYSDWAHPIKSSHDPKTNGLKYLRDYSLHRANEIMTSPNYTRAIFVRDPKERFLSAYLEKAVGLNGTYLLHNGDGYKCCKTYPNRKACVQQARASLSNFLSFVRRCDDPHWRRQSRRMENKYWPHLDFVGHMETAAADAKALLTRIGAWEEFGRTGWGPNGTDPIFTATAQKTVLHATHAKNKMLQWYTPDLERRVEHHYRADYSNQWLNLTMTPQMF